MSTPSAGATVLKKNASGGHADVGYTAIAGSTHNTAFTSGLRLAF
jgi:hypothetical protein